MYVKWLLIFGIAVLLSSCGTHLFTMDDIMMLEKGISRKEVQKMVDLEPRLGKKFSNEGKVYSCEMYHLKVSERTEGRFDAKGNYSTSKIDIYDEYFFLYDSNDRVFYWGFLGELTASDDTIIKGIGTYIKDNLKQWQDN